MAARSWCPGACRCAGGGDGHFGRIGVTTLPYWSSILAMIEASVLPAVALAGCWVIPVRGGGRRDYKAAGVARSTAVGDGKREAASL